MKKFYLAALLIFTMNAFASLGEDVFIRGKIGNDFNDKQVKIIDSLGQSYYLPSHVFPKNFKFKQGQPFAIDVPGNHLQDVKIIRK
ncbi:MAG TPA: hypothetical protein VNJ08_04555 [Bacteriovoracaceae bacterium]|nr:hypothetical protein [Bacteriovoracaceae bacterium]